MTSKKIYDVVGLGFGPANIAIAGAILEASEKDKTSTNASPLSAIFFDKHSEFAWHPGMLLPDARMQISFLKDLATLRNPRSPITFLSYLQSQDRLVTFINRGSTIPTRKEYADYLAWAARWVQDAGVPVHFGTAITNIEDGPNDTALVSTRNLATGTETIYRARNLIISPGGTPRVPRSLQTVVHHPLVIHSASYALSIGPVLDTLRQLARPLRIGVVGGGQSAAEVSIDLLERLKSIPARSPGEGHQIDMIIRKGSLKPSDDTPFSNEIFDPSETDNWFSIQSRGTRDTQLREYKSTNYGVVNPRTIEHLYELMYDQKVDQSVCQRKKATNLSLAPPSNPRIVFRPYSNVVASSSDDTTELTTTSDGITITTQNLFTDAITSQKYDAVVCATGYQRHAWIDLMKSTAAGKHFGLSADTEASLCTLQPNHMQEAESKFSQIQSSVSPASSLNASADSTPPTSPAQSVAHLEGPKGVELYINRNYRLVPQDDMKARVYLQGVEEATHGLSDTLLSVLGVRAGEVVNDLARTSA